MASSHLIDAEQLLADQLAQASPDLLRGLLSTFIAALMGPKPTPCVGRATANAAMSGPISATVTANAISTPVLGPSTSRSPSCARAATSRTGCWSAASEPNGRSPAWWRPATYWVSPPAGWSGSRGASSAVKTSAGRAQVVPWIRCPAILAHQMSAARCAAARSVNVRPSQKFPRTYCTARSTRGLSFGERTRAGSVANPRRIRRFTLARNKNGCAMTCRTVRS